MRLFAVFLLVSFSAMAQTTQLRTGIVDIDEAWDICGRQTDEAFILDCTHLRNIRQKFPVSPQPVPSPQDFGDGNLAYIQSIAVKWSHR
jgi:hypothetical protein